VAVEFGDYDVADLARLDPPDDDSDTFCPGAGHHRAATAPQFPT
jgi:hypothetical protein